MKNFITIDQDFFLSIFILLIVFAFGYFFLKASVKNGSNRQQFETDYNALKDKIDSTRHYLTLIQLKREVANLYQKYCGYDRDIDRLQRRCVQQIEVYRPRAS